MQKQLEHADLLLGRKTFEIFANYWPDHAEHRPGVMDIAKHALSTKLADSDLLVKRFTNSTVLRNLEDTKKLKNSHGAGIKIWGSSKLGQLLLQHDLVDEFWLNIYPIILGNGKSLF